MRLTDVSYNPKWNDLTNNWTLPTTAPAKPYAGGDTYEATGTSASDHGYWDALELDPGSNPIGANYIYNYPNGKQYFGLMMASGANFNVNAGPQYAGSGWTDGTTISGSPYTNMVRDFATAQVGASVNASPEINFYMLYDNRFSHTLVGTISFTLEEHRSVRKRDANGVLIEPAEWIDSNLNSPIEVELTITTILQDFTNMEYEVLAMYNEGRSNYFSRKVVLPATLQQRELYLDSIAWFPTVIDGPANGDTIRTESARDNHGTLKAQPDWFFLTNDMNKIKNQADGHSYFGMMVQPIENVSNSLVSAVSWHTISQTEPLDLFEAGYSVGEEPTEPARAYNNQYYQEAVANPTHKIGVKSLIDAESAPHGIKMGNLDGRGDAALNVTLKYDGNRVYEKFSSGKGYVGKVVLYLKSYTGGRYNEPNPFQITINVKTRDHGDTIYLASNDYFNNPAYYYESTPGTHVISGSYYAQKADWSATDPGKNPHSCATSFYDALTKVYQEGDVVAIIGEVKIGPGEQQLIKGEEYMPIPVIRYEGHHRFAPGEECVYRGPMITVEGNAAHSASFSARCIEFKGSMLSKIEPALTDGTPAPYPSLRIIPDGTFTNAHPLVFNQVDQYDYKYADTNVAYGPVIRVKGYATVNLQHGVVIHQNNNGYWSPAYQAAQPDVAADWTGTTFDPSMMGAVSVTNGGTLKLVNTVNIKHNLSNDISSPSNWHIKPEGGAVYVDGGTMYLSEANKTTHINIDSNYRYDGTPYWYAHTIRDNSEDKLVHYDFNISTDPDTNGYYATNPNHRRANVYLARYEVTSIPDDITALGSTAIQNYKDTHDFKSSVIVFDHSIPENTRIGVSKWFPDEAEEMRDTIQIAFQADGTYMQEAAFNQNFQSDDPQYFTFYNYGINNQRMYLARCATFKYQASGLYLAGDASNGVATGEALSYRPLSGASCPIGGDSLIVRAQGGFFPYTYTWSNPGDDFYHPEDDVVLRTRKTTGTNNEVNKQMNLAEPNYEPLANAVADTILTDNIDMSYSQNQEIIRYIVTTSDATGGCTLTKKVEVTLKKDHSYPSPDDFVKTGVTGVWTAQDDPNTVNEDSCTGNRNYRSVIITPKVWSPGTGAIAVTSNKDPNIYIIDGNTQPEVANLRFCEGDVLSLITEPKKVNDEPVAKFMMWDFDPFYSNPTTYIVPATDKTVIAYYAPLDYWKDTITSTTLAKAYYDEHFTYTDANYPSGAGMVTTYNGDVHIYNEDGLAWLISCVNGYNGTQARTFHFNRVYIHDKADGYDMGKYLWTPMGTLQHPFEGMLIGVSGGEANIAPWTATSPDTAWTSPVVIKNIIVDEPNLENAGFFAVMDSARIINIELQGVTVRAAQNVGALAGRSSHSRMRRVNVTSAGLDGSGNDDPSITTTTILSTHYISGGLIGLSDHDTIKHSSNIGAKFVGDAVYSGGVVGYGIATQAVNNNGFNDSRLRGLYVGGMAGYLKGEDSQTGLFRRKTTGEPSRFENNYFRVNATRQAQRVGGVVGYAENSIIANNYIYGDIDADIIGGVTAQANDGTKANHNYYENSAAKMATASERGNTVITDISAFEGQGNRVTLETPVYGVDNLTRVLNKWVREQNAAGGDYLTWRSDLEQRNFGYPIFGTPDTIPVEATLHVDGCDEVEWEGTTYTADITLTSNVFDATEMIDSTTTINIQIHHSVYTNLADSAIMEEGYEGYGFTVTPTEAMLLNRTILVHGSAQMVLTDTLNTMFGCDSVVTLTLTFTGNLGVPEVEVTPTASVKVYPNPTVDFVNVEADDLMHVELYDNEGRTLADYDARTGDNVLRLNVSHLATGIYYLRIHTATAVTIQKFVKR